MSLRGIMPCNGVQWPQAKLLWLNNDFLKETICMSVSTYLLTLLGAAAGGLVTFIASIGVYIWQEIPDTPNFDPFDFHTWYYFTAVPDQSVWAISIALYALFACVFFLALTLMVIAIMLFSVGVSNNKEKRLQNAITSKEIEDKQNLISSQIEQLNTAEIRDQTAAAKDNAIACAYQQLELALSKANSVDEINEALKVTVQLLNHLSSNTDQVNIDKR